MTNKTDREQAEDLLAGIDDFEHGSDEQIRFITQAFAEIRKEFEDLSCSKCGNPWGDGWLPIETAPKEANDVLLFNGWVNIGFYAPYLKRFVPCEHTDKNNIEFSPQPTHWMPLPAAPKGEL